MLDVFTVIVFVNAVMLFICVVTGLARWAGEPGAETETRYWFDASLMQLAGTLTLTAADYLHADFVAVLSGFLLTAATGFLTLGYRQMYGLPAEKRWPLLIAFLTVAATLLVRFVSEGRDDGIYIVYLGAAFNLGVGACAVWFGSGAAEMRFGRATALLLTVYAAGCLAIAPLAFFFPLRIVNGELESLWLELSTVPLFVLNLAAFLMTLIARLERATEKQRYLATHDALTAALNRRAFYETWTREIGRGGTLALLDLDHFKSVNDTHGHLTGDVTLKTFASVVADGLPKGTFFGRLGGEEFAILFPGDQPVVAEQVLEATRNSVASTVIQSCQGRSFKVTFSSGLAVFDGDDADINRIFAAADCALYVAKSTGRNRIVAFEPVMLRQLEPPPLLAAQPEHRAKAADVPDLDLA